MVGVPILKVVSGKLTFLVAMELWTFFREELNLILWNIAETKLPSFYGFMDFLVALYFFEH